MRTHFWQGELIQDQELRRRIDELEAFVLKGHQVNFQIEEFYRACDRFSARLCQETALSQKLSQILVESAEANIEDAPLILEEIAEFLQETSLRQKLNSEFGTDNPFRSERVSKQKPVFESWFPLGFLVQILASNSPSLAVLSAFEALITGNINFIKLSKSSSDFTIRFFEEFFKDPIAKTWQDLLIVAKVSSGEKDMLTQVLTKADGVVAWGGEEALAEIRKMTPTRARFIEWGHRISFGYITQNKLKDGEIFDKIAKDVFLYDQQACSSPQCIFIEDASFSQLKDFSESLKLAFIKKAGREKLNMPSDLEAAEITRSVEVIKTEKALRDDFTDVIESENNEWRILVDSRQGLRASPLYRSIWLKPLQRKDILSILRPLSQYLQTVGLGCERDELFALTQELYKAGATRIRPLGEMLSSYSGEPHDGVSALTCYMKKVSLEQYCELESFATLDDLRVNEIYFSEPSKKIMTKEDFQQMTPPVDSCELFFKSGGSSGEPKISVFTYRDYHRQMRFAADGMLAAGLDPAHDRCMNLFFSGGLYGSFLSIFSVLEDLKLVQFPMTANMDFDFVAEMIIKHKVNVLLGMPSYLLQLLNAKKDLFQENRVIKKIFFGGEFFSTLQRERLKSDFGITDIISATYGSVDMGPLGYQCKNSEGGVHHLHQDLHRLEILDIEKDIPVQKGETGRLVFSSHGRHGLRLHRYDVGDLGAWVDEPCVCGRKSPRFELKGRQGDIFRAAGSFLNFNKFTQILSDQFSYSHETQIILEKKDAFDELRLFVDVEQNQSLPIRSALIVGYKELSELVQAEHTLKFEVCVMPSSEFLRAAGSGKLLKIIDRRGK